MKTTMINVILYSRVSTDEQADGCSLDVQERRLKDYCERNNYHIIESYREDFSAKHHDLRRPEMKKIYDYCRKHNDKVDKILFLRWDRFTRNCEFALTYKRKFKDELKIEINAIENPIDFSTPEWATLFPLYCGVAHTEDEKISKRTKDGIHGTLLKGKCSGRVPLGYKNVRISKHDCWVEVDEKTADIVRVLFNEVAKGIETPTFTKNRLYPDLPDSTFFRILRNRFYAGYVHVPAYEGDPDQYVKGQHEALIDLKTYELVQEILDGNRKYTPRLVKTLNPNLYLRKFLVCPVCGHSITGAPSRGNGGKYNYYFCNGDHKHLNVRAEKVNEGFVNYISALKPKAPVLALYREILNDIRGERTKSLERQITALKTKKNEINKRIDRINDCYFDGEISKEERENNIQRQSNQLEELERQVSALEIGLDSKLKNKLDYSINIIENIGEFFAKAPAEVKVKLIGSIFPEKIEYDGKNYRTKSCNKMLEYIYQGVNDLVEIKKESDSKNHSQNQLGCDVGLFSNQFLEDLEKIWALREWISLP